MLLPPDAGGCMDLLTDGDPAMVRGAPVAAETCECTCAGECDLRVFTDPECQSLNGTIGALDSACVSLPSNATIRNGNAAAAASCDAPAASAPTVAFDLHHRLCDAPPDTCVPVPAGAVGLCVRRPGEHECMDPEFGQQIVTMTDVQLECEDCGPCGRTLGLACGEAILTQYSDLLCTNDAVVLESNMCSLNTVGSARMDFNFSCPASDVQATEINITTYCCA